MTPCWTCLLSWNRHSSKGVVQAGCSFAGIEPHRLHPKFSNHEVPHFPKAFTGIFPQKQGKPENMRISSKIKAPLLVSISSQTGEYSEAYTETKRRNLAWKLGQGRMCVKGCFYSRCLFSCDSSYQRHLGRIYAVTAYATITWILLSHSWGLFMRLRKAITKPTIIHGLSKISTWALLSHEDDKCVSNKDCSPLLQFQQFKMNI